VADYDPMNDHRGSLARGYEPTSKAMHASSKYIIFLIFNSSSHAGDSQKTSDEKKKLYR